MWRTSGSRSWIRWRSWSSHSRRVIAPFGLQLWGVAAVGVAWGVSFGGNVRVGKQGATRRRRTWRHRWATVLFSVDPRGRRQAVRHAPQTQCGRALVVLGLRLPCAPLPAFGKLRSWGVACGVQIPCEASEDFGGQMVRCGSQRNLLPGRKTTTNLEKLRRAFAKKATGMSGMLRLLRCATSMAALSPVLASGQYVAAGA
jgi:hypothetical protein